MNVRSWWESRERNQRLVGAAAVAVACLAAGWVVTWLVGPHPPELAAATSGDDELAARVEELLAADRAGLDALVVAVIEDGEVRTAGFGHDATGQPVTDGTAFEIGSVTKGLTGMLLADLIDGGELAPDDRLGSLDGGIEQLEGTGDGATLEALASHRAGYPRLPGSSVPRTILTRFTGGDPYTGDADDVLAEAVATDVTSGEYAYSNLGVAALGDGLAAQAGRPYAELLADRILAPLGMDETHVLGPGSDLPAPRAVGRESGNGRAAEPWLATGWPPAGVGIWSTATDLSRRVAGLLDGSAPGAPAVEPRFTVSEHRSIGYGWFTESGSADTIVWHNGGTGGFSSWVGYAPDTGRGAVVLSNTTRSLDELGERLVLDDATPLPGRSPDFPIAWLLALVTVGGLVPSLSAVVRALVGGQGDRRGLLHALTTAVILLTLARSVGPWDVIPRVFWTVAAAQAVAIVVGTVLTWSRLPTSTGSWPRLQWTTTGLGGAVALVLLALVA